MKKFNLIALFTVIFLEILSFSNSEALDAGTFLAFGPKSFIRTTGKPAILLEDFSVLDPNTSYMLHVYNGGKNNGFKASSAFIHINGTEIVRPDAFNQTVSHIEKPVELLNSNVLTVDFRSKPGCGLTIEIIGVDDVPPTIVATSDPPPNPAGWNNTDVTVTFACSDTTSGIASCPDPVLVQQEGAHQVVTGTATDNAGNTASASVTINLDKTPPHLVVTEPNGDVEESPATIRGTATDALSGTAGVTCYGTAAQWSGAEFICSVAVQEGPNTVLVEARDFAGNVSTSTVTFMANLAHLELKYNEVECVQVHRDHSMGVDRYYRPKGIPAGYYSLGDVSSPKDDIPPFALVVKELKAGALAEPVKWEMVHLSRVGMFERTGLVLKPVPPPGYHCLGVAIRDYSIWGEENASSRPEDNVRCVRSDLITTARLGTRLNSFPYRVYPNQSFSTWQVFPANDSEGIFTGQFAWSYNDGPPLFGSYYTISADAVRKPRLSSADVVDLIESFGPTITLYPGDYYLPDDPNYVLDNSMLQWGTVQNEWDYNSHNVNVIGEIPTSSSTLMDDAAYAQTFNDPPDSSFRTWIKIPEPTSGNPSSPAGGDFIRGDLSRARVLVRARTWNSLFTELQFWTYYPFNGPGKFHAVIDSMFGELYNDHEWMDTCGRHYSDWEHVSVLFDSGLPVSLYVSRHDLNVWISRKDFGFLWDRGVHPVIYAARDSHAHYTTVGRHHYKRVVDKGLGIANLYVDLEDYAGAGNTLQTFNPATYWFVSSDIPGVDPIDPEPDWLQFPGRWGQYEKLSYTYIVPFALGDYEYTQEEVGAGPSGPAMKTSWQKGDWCVFSDTCQ